MKIIRLAGVSTQAATDSLYNLHPGLALRSFAEQQKQLFDQAYMYSNTFSKEMRKLGHWAEEIVYDVKPLQKMWMQEQGLKFDETHWCSQTVLAQLKFYQPEILFFQDIHALPYELKSSLKKEIPSIKKIIIFRGFPGVDHKLFKELALADLLLVGSPILFEKCRLQGLKPHLIYHYFDEAILSSLSSNWNKSIDFSFMGSSGYGHLAHRDRYQTLVTLLEKTNIELWVDEPRTKKSFKGAIAKAIRLCFDFCSPSFLEALNKTEMCPAKLAKLIDESLSLRASKEKDFKPPGKPLSKLFPNRCQGPLFGLDMFQKLRESKIVFNKHSIPAQGSVDNMRMFQATGVGSCLLTDTGYNMGDLFDPDREVITYSSLEECIEKWNYLLSHDSVREEVAMAGHKRTLKDHSAKMRCAQINELIRL
jgi:spore maturation protein CgeB